MTTTDPRFAESDHLKAKRHSERIRTKQAARVAKDLLQGADQLLEQAGDRLVKAFGETGFDHAELKQARDLIEALGCDIENALAEIHASEASA